MRGIHVVALGLIGCGVLGCQDILGIEIGERASGGRGGVANLGGGGVTSTGGNAGVGGTGGVDASGGASAGGCADMGGGGAGGDPLIETLIPSLIQPGAIASDATHLYWVETPNAAIVYRAEIGAWDPTLVQSSGVNTDASIALTNTEVVIAFEAGAVGGCGTGARNVTVYRKQKDGTGTPTTLRTGCALGVHLATLAEEHVYTFSVGSSHEVWRGDAASDSLVDGTRAFPMSAVGVNNESVFVSDLDGIDRRVGDGWSRVDAREAVKMVADQTAVWWYTTDAELFRKPAGGETESLGMVAQIADIALWEGQLYYVTGGVTNSGTLGTIDACDVQRDLKANLSQPNSLTVTSDHVYWTDIDDGLINRIPR